MKNDRVKVRCYYTDYVVHMIRFYLSTPGGLDLQKRDYSASSIANWSAVQMVFNRMGADDKKLVIDVFGCGHYLPKAVDVYCDKNGIDTDEGKDNVYRVMTRVFAKIARVRGLM